MSNVKVIRENSSAGGGMVYCLGLIGAVVYFFSHADTFGQYIIGLLKALVWPAYLVYHALGFFNL